MTKASGKLPEGRKYSPHTHTAQHTQRSNFRRAAAFSQIQGTGYNTMPGKENILLEFGLRIKHRKRVEPQREETLKILKKWLSLCKFSPNIQTELSSQVSLPYSREQILLFMFSNWLISSAIPLFFVFRCLGWASPLSTSFCYFTLRPT